MSVLEWDIRSIRSSGELKKYLERNSSKLDAYDWIHVTRHTNFTNDLIEMYPDKISWSFLCTFSNLSVEIMDKYSEKLEWYSISAFQVLTKGFIEKYQHKLSLPKVLKNEKTPSHLRGFIQELIEINDDPSHHKRWDQNLRDAKVFCPKDFKGHYKDYNDKTLMAGTDEWALVQSRKRKTKVVKKVVEEKPKVETDYSSLSKAQLKEILKERNVRVYYHDTLDILRKKCKESE